MPFSTVADAFSELLKRIELNPARSALASQRYNAVKSTVEAALPGKTVSQIGSFQRKTKIRPADLSDALDMDAVVNFKRFTQYTFSEGEGVSPSKALEIVRRALTSNQTYRVMAPVKDHPVVTLQYADEMKIELIPAFADATERTLILALRLTAISSEHRQGIGNPRTTTTTRRSFRDSTQ